MTDCAEETNPSRLVFTLILVMWWSEPYLSVLEWVNECMSVYHSLTECICCHSVDEFFVCSVKNSLDQHFYCTKFQRPLARNLTFLFNFNACSTGMKKTREAIFTDCHLLQKNQRIVIYSGLWFSSSQKSGRGIQPSQSLLINLVFFFLLEFFRRLDFCSLVKYCQRRELHYWEHLSRASRVCQDVGYSSKGLQEILKL